jgi:hypothetical protein
MIDNMYDILPVCEDLKARGAEFTTRPQPKRHKSRAVLKERDSPENASKSSGHP